MKTGISKNQQLMINLFASVITMVINYGISLMLTPYIVSTVGGIAYGFVSLANNMVNYASVITIALNSVSGRFITIHIHQGKKEEANQYFNSVLLANAVIAAGVLAIAVPAIWNLDKLVHIPTQLVTDVKMLFAFITLNFVLTIIGDVFTVATFITNKLYLSSIVNSAAGLLKVALMLLMFGFLPTNVAYIGIISVACTAVIYVCNAGLTKHLIPELKLKFRNFSFKKIRELISAGIWSSVTKLSQILSDGLDLLISNIGVGAYAMGQLSIAYTIPTLLSSLLSTIASLFNPQQTYFYAKGDIEGVVNELKINMKMTSFFISVVFCGIVVWGQEFFKLWVPSQNTQLIYILSIISIISVLVSGVTSALNSVFLLTNHLKTNSLVWLAISVVDTVIVLTFVMTTNLGVYAVAGVSKIIGLIVNLVYLPLYASKCLKISKKTFYPIIVRYMVCTAIVLGMFYLMKKFFGPCTNWLTFLLYCGIFAAAGLGINFVLFLNKHERSYLITAITSRVKGKNHE